ncbi:MAG: energy transducer TonB [Candidatus Marinimicrobia bacterium]|nr:energy transducer TonB [Candidatus Neomarinimicrobiota bacterium]MCF7828615.1 energy transducer TonB [Candidatus Neomarinimicrobiota bacterium]MCF7880356.1 energy transducer TonB [Candidatus Neomarinimicrobiota bacterium]
MKQTFIDIFADLRKTIAASGVLHILILLLLMLMKIGMDVERPEYAEINFVASQQESSTPTPAPRTTQREQVTPEPPEQEAQEAEQEEPAEPEVSQTQAAAPQAPPVNLPERRMQEEEDPEIVRRNSEKLNRDTGTERLPMRADVYEERKAGDVSNREAEGEKLSANPQQMDLQDEGVAPTTEVGGPSGEQPFQITGEAAERSILSKTIPEYPQDLQREAVIRIRFTVTPDGRVGQMIPVQKDYPELEALTLDALKEWRFNPLPPSAEQRAVEGIITFRYVLE